MGDGGVGARDCDTLESWAREPAEEAVVPSPSESEPAIVRATRDQRAAERRGVMLLICCRVIRPLVTTLSRGSACDRCAPEEGLPASSPPAAGFSPSLLPWSLLHC